MITKYAAEIHLISGTILPQPRFPDENFKFYIPIIVETTLSFNDYRSFLARSIAENDMICFVNHIIRSNQIAAIVLTEVPTTHE